MPRHAENPADLGPREPGGAGRIDGVFVSLAGGCQIIARSRQRSAGLAAIDLWDDGVGSSLLFGTYSSTARPSSSSVRWPIPISSGSSIHHGLRFSIGIAFPNLSSID
jgi:hypothetical protein